MPTSRMSPREDGAECRGMSWDDAFDHAIASYGPAPSPTPNANSSGASNPKNAAAAVNTTADGTRISVLQQPLWGTTHTPESVSSSRRALSGTHSPQPLLTSPSNSSTTVDDMAGLGMLQRPAVFVGQLPRTTSNIPTSGRTTATSPTGRRDNFRRHSESDAQQQPKPGHQHDESHPLQHNLMSSNKSFGRDSNSDATGVAGLSAMGSTSSAGGTIRGMNAEVDFLFDMEEEDVEEAHLAADVE